MAHECWECGQQCYCDGDDTGGMPVPDDCLCWLDHYDEDDLGEPPATDQEPGRE